MAIFLYILSFIILFFAEICQTLHTIYVSKHKNQLAALFAALSSALWCIKIVVIINQPLTIITAFIGSWLGAIVAFKLESKFTDVIK